MSSVFKSRDWYYPATALLIIAMIVRLGRDFEHLLLGWIYFPVAVLPQMTVYWPALVLGAVCTAVFMVGMHLMVRSSIRSWASPDSPLRRWSLRSTFALSLVVLMLFLAGTAMVAATHQLIWLVSGRSHANDQQRILARTPVVSLQETARRLEQESNMRMLGTAFMNYADTFGGYPAGGIMNQYGELLHGWFVAIALYHNYSPRDIDYSLPWNQPPNDRIYKCNVVEIVNPALPGPYFDDQGFGIAHVAGNIHVLPINQRHKPNETTNRTEPPFELTRGRVNSTTTAGNASNTILLGTVGQQFKPWGHPANVRDPALGINRTPAGFGGPPSWRGAMFTMCDGSVRFMSNETDPSVMQTLAGRPAQD